ncbi:MAG: DNA translocase FtsK 4TM domain-containing protein [Devosia nanyangense]|uniref:DNA translocase FtsK n=1 Tax=Devosia nanyangense TaxID=1228055 RepID=A0A933NYD9_9HYPH|nr:DNA translocase FtsK 4TM domain-containing protein [Devosia nanyangense]
MPARPLIEDKSSAPAPAIAITIPVRLIGLVLLALVGLMMAALASWSVDDPSLSFAATRPVQNWLGVPGAIAADLSFQVFGLGIIVMLIPVAMWGWSFVRRRVPSLMGLRLIAWIAAALLSTGVLAFLPVPASWPLPTGLGGLIGAGFANLAALVTGANPQPVTAWLFAIILVAPTLALCWIACGLGALRLPQAAAPKARTKGKAAAADEPDRNGILDVAIGALVHLAFSAQTALRRAIARARDNAAARREAEAAAWRDGAVEPSMAGRTPLVSPDVRVEPQLTSGRLRFAPMPEPAFEDDYPAEEEDEEIAVAPARAARVAAPAKRPAPGSRAAREAQGSLLEDESGFELPELSLLAEPRHRGLSDEHRPERLEAMARRLEGVLEDFGVRGDIINVRPGPVVTLYELEPAPGIKSSRVISLADDIARSMSAISARVAVVPGRNAIGIELPNENRETVYLREMLASADFEKMKGKLNICLGKTIGGEPIIADLARMPHLLIAGTTGSGKSVGINTMILSILYRMTPAECRLIMIDPKMLELSVYDGIPHLLTPVVTDPSKAVTALKWAVREMEDRYRKMSKIGVRNIDGFNQRVSEAAQKGETITRTVQTGFDRETGEAIYESEQFNLETLPFIVVIVDEMADLMMVAGKDIEGAIQRLAQMARAAGIHIIMATQRPSVDVITGTIKANFPTRISFQVTSKIDSRTILGEQGAEQLLGNGDMLYMAGGGRIRRLHGPFVADGEVEDVVRHLKSQGAPDYLDSITAEDDEFDPASALGEDGGGSGDELYDKAVNIVLNDKKASTSYVQRRLAIGYNKAASLIERMEKEGVISAANHSGKREILVGGEGVY